MEKLFNIKLSKIYPLLVAKAQKKNRSEEEVIACITWLTGYDEEKIKDLLLSDITYKDFFVNAPCMNEKRYQVKGSICGVKIEAIEDPIYKDIRILDKLIDDLAKGKSLEKLLP